MSISVLTMATCEGLFETEIRGGGFVITRADPQVHASDKILSMFAHEHLPPGMLDLEPGRAKGDYTGAILRIIDSTGRRVVYRVTGPCGHGDWHLIFPD